MASLTDRTRTVLSTLAVTGALFVGSQPATANASDPSPFLTAAFEAIAEEFGDGFGHIMGQDDAGATVFLATFARREYALYTSGDPVGYDDTLAFCQQASTGGLTSCQEVPHDEDYECDSDEYGSWCWCSGLDCVSMFADMCTEGGDSYCDGGECICDA